MLVAAGDSHEQSGVSEDDISVWWGAKKVPSISCKGATAEKRPPLKRFTIVCLHSPRPVTRNNRFSGHDETMNQ